MGAPRLVLRLVVLAASALAGAAGAQPVRFERLPALQGDSPTAPTLREVYTDAAGFVWLATEEGLIRYDGVEAHVFRADPGRPDGLPTNLVQDVAGADGGRLWLKTPAGIYRFDPATGRAERLVGASADERAGSGLVGYSTRALASDRAGRLLYVVNLTGLRLARPGRRGASPVVLPGAAGHVFVSGTDPRGRAWVTTASGGVYRVDLRSGRVRRYVLPGPGAPAAWAEAALNAAGEVWVFAAGGLYRYRSEADRFALVLPGARWPSLATGLPASDGTAALRRENQGFLVDSRGTLWVGATGRPYGVLAVDLATGRAVRHLHVPGEATSPPAPDGISPVAEDPSGGLWFWGRLDPRRVPPPHAAFRHVALPAPGLATRLGLGRAGRLLAASFPGEPLRLGPDGAFRPLARVDLRAMALHEDRRGNIWIPDFGGGPLGGGVVRLAPGGGVHVYGNDPADPASLRSSGARAVLEDTAGRIWVGTETGLDRYDPATDGWAHVRAPAALADLTVWALAPAGGGRLWVGTYGDGLWRYDPATGRARAYRHDPADPASLPSDLIVGITPSRAVPGHVWVATYDGGVALLDPATGRARRFTTPDGLPSNAARMVLEDRRGRAWVSTQAGLVRIATRRALAGEPGALHAFTEADGLAGTAFTMYGGAALPDGRLAFATTEHVVVFDPDAVDAGRVAAPVALTAFRVDDRARPVEAVPRALRLAPGERFFAVEFAAPDPDAGRRTRYRYRLDGLDAAWVESGSRRYASYTNVPPGRYTLRVEADAGTGWGARGLAVPVVVAPAWWQRRAVRALAGLALALLLVGVGVAAARGPARRQLAAVEAERRAERRVQAERERISRDLHDHVGGRLAALLAEAEAARFEGSPAGALRAVEDGARETMAGLRESVWALHDAVLTVDALAEQVRRLTAPRARAFGARVEVAVEGDAARRLSPQQALHLLRIAQEAVTNALKHGGGPGVRVRFAVAEGLALTVDDDGPPPPAAYGPAGGAAAPGYGLRSMQTRAEALGGTFRFDPAGGPRGGAVLHVRVPLPEPAAA